MIDRLKYRLSEKQKNIIAQNLIDILETNTSLLEESRTFISNWILSGPDEKRKAFYDVWDIVLKNYFPKTTPILFRACGRIEKRQKIASFTSSINCAYKMGRGKGMLVICDTKESLEFEKNFYTNGNFKNTFYPLVSVLTKVRDSGERFLNDYIGEEEYIMRTSLPNMHYFRFVDNDF